MFKALSIIIVMLLAAYPVGELSRCIITYNILPGWGTWEYLGASLWDYIAELGVMWFLYLLIPLAMSRFIDFARRGAR